MGTPVWSEAKTGAKGQAYFTIIPSSAIYNSNEKDPI